MPCVASVACDILSLEREECKMKISLHCDPAVSEAEIRITCPAVTEEIKDVLAYISLIDNTIAGTRGEETFFIPLTDILYFETVDRKVFFYTAADTYETATKMYRLEEKLDNTPFLRISKSLIANLKKARSIKPERNSRMSITLSNGEKLIVSRQYLQAIKEKLGVK